MKRPPKKTATLEVRMPQETKSAFIEACRSEGRTASEAVRGFVERTLRRAARRERLREHLKPDRSLAMMFSTPTGRRVGAGAGVAAALGAALGVFALTGVPSAAAPDYRAMFERMDSDHDGKLTAEELAARMSGGGSGNMVFILQERQVTTDDASPPETTAEEFWLPVTPPPAEAAGGGAGAGDGEHVVRVVRRFEDGQVVTEEVEGLGPASPDLADAQARMFMDFDADRDGVVSFEEFQGRHHDMIGATFRRLDADGDGRLSAEELTAVPMLFTEEGVPALPAEAGLGRTLELLDADHDGAVSLEEFGGAG